MQVVLTVKQKVEVEEDLVLQVLVELQILRVRHLLLIVSLEKVVVIMEMFSKC